jgi:hypothetical protein
VILIPSLDALAATDLLTKLNCLTKDSSLTLELRADPTGAEDFLSGSLIGLDGRGVCLGLATADDCFSRFIVGFSTSCIPDSVSGRCLGSTGAYVFWIGFKLAGAIQLDGPCWRKSMVIRTIFPLLAMTTALVAAPSALDLGRPCSSMVA